MKNLEAEQHRVLLKRITKAIDGARYHPADYKDADAAATEVLRPYVGRDAAPDAAAGEEWPQRPQALWYQHASGGVLSNGHEWIAYADRIRYIALAMEAAPAAGDKTLERAAELVKRHADDLAYQLLSLASERGPADQTKAGDLPDTAAVLDSSGKAADNGIGTQSSAPETATDAPRVCTEDSDTANANAESSGAFPLRPLTPSAAIADLLPLVASVPPEQLYQSVEPAASGASETFDAWMDINWPTWREWSEASREDANLDCQRLAFEAGRASIERTAPTPPAPSGETPLTDAVITSHEIRWEEFEVSIVQLARSLELTAAGLRSELSATKATLALSEQSLRVTQAEREEWKRVAELEIKRDRNA